MARSTTDPERLTLREAIADLGWFSATFAALVGGPSVLSLMQMVFVEHRLVDALQWIVDGYDGIVAVLGATLEPLMRPMIAWLNDLLGWRLELQPHWKPLLLLVMVVVSTLARSALRGGFGAWEAFSTVARIIAAFIGAVAAGLVPLTGAWWEQGLAAA